MPRNDLTIQHITEEIESSLGSSGVEVELASDDYEKVIKEAVRVLNRHRPQVGAKALPVTPTQKKYLIDIPHVQGITEVNFVSQTVGAQIDPFDTINNNLGTMLSASGTPFGEIDQQIQYIEQSRAVASAEPEWQQLWEGDKLYLYVDIVRTPMWCSFKYTWHLLPTDDPNYGIGMIPQGDTDFLIGFALARAKIVLARIRGKHGGIATPEGSTDPVEADTLLQEGREEEEKWTEEIRKRRRPLLPVIG